VERVLSSDLGSRVGERAIVQGWVHRRRRLAVASFLILRDRYGLVQVVVKDEATLRVLDEIGEETVVEVEGTVIANEKARSGYELVDPEIRVLSTLALTPPVELWRPALDASLPVLLDHAPVLWRHPAQRAILRVSAATMRGFRRTLDAKGFTEIQTPKLVASSTESGANVFGVDYFGRTAYLAQSPQFYKQIMVGVFERVYEIGPVFRAEPHDTARHLAEYVSLDVEFGFIRSHREVLAMLRDVIAGMADEIRQTASAEAEQIGAMLPDVPAEIPVVHFSEALKIVDADPDEPDLAPEHERRLGEWARAEHASDFLAVEGYPARKRPFYTHPQPDDPQWTNSFDLIFRGIELVTGGQRLHRYEDYLQALTVRGESTQPYESYLQAFQYGMPPHGGFAIGLERWLARLVEAENVRRVTLFPRDLNRLTP
jgi:nondiscriminating aspartyl-tRNA synthetase